MHRQVASSCARGASDRSMPRTRGEILFVSWKGERFIRGSDDLRHCFAFGSISDTRQTCTCTRAPAATGPISGGRAWWAHFKFTRINIEPTILRKKIEDVREARATLLSAAHVGGVPLQSHL